MKMKIMMMKILKLKSIILILKGLNHVLTAD